MSELVPEELVPLFTDDELINLRSIKLTNGNDILACILSSDTQIMIVKRPCLVVRIVSEDGHSTTILTKWQAFSEGEVHVVNTHAVVSYCKITTEMLEFYLQSVKHQISDEIKAKEPIVGSEWPEWMNQPLAKHQVN